MEKKKTTDSALSGKAAATKKAVDKKVASTKKAANKKVASTKKAADKKATEVKKDLKVAKKTADKKVATTKKAAEKKSTATNKAVKKKTAEAKEKAAASKKTADKKVTATKKAAASKKATAAEKTTAAKKTVEKKTATSKKAADKKVTATKKAAATKKTATKKADTAKKTVEKKTATSKKAADKKADEAKKTVAKAKKTAEKKVVAKKTPSKKAPEKKEIKKDEPAKKEGKKVETKITPTKKVLFAAFEAAPFLKTGGLGDVAGSLPKYINRANNEWECRVILPKLAAIPQYYQEKMEFVESYGVPLSWRTLHCGLFKLELDGVIYYFLDNEYYFNRDQVYGEFDDGERMAFYSKAVLETIAHISGDFHPDVLHSNDWHAALIPVFLREFYMQAPGYENIKTVFTIHNLKFQGQYSKFVISDILGMEGNPAVGQLIHEDACNYLQGAVIYSDAVNTVSPTYANEICTPQYGEGLEGLFDSRRYKLSGIVNGIDYESYDPKTDIAIPKHFDVDHIGDKVENKLALQREMGLPEDRDTLLFGLIGRLTPQKGVHLVTHLLSRFPDRNMQFVLLGTGMPEFEQAFQNMANYRPDKVAVRIDFDESLARRIYAGVDVFMMPSQFEPCGLAQMMAMRYGTLPLVRQTGGLNDTVKGYWDFGQDATGFSFTDFDDNGLLFTIDTALRIYFDERDTFEAMRRNAMNQDFSWESSALEYCKLYQRLISEG